MWELNNIKGRIGNLDNKLITNNEKIDKLTQIVENLEKEMYILKADCQSLTKDRVVHTVAEKEIELPAHLYTTYITLINLGGRVQAEHISAVTKKARAIESTYLNQLVVIGVMKKERVGRKVFYMLQEK